MTERGYRTDGVGTLVSRVVEDARELAHAEIDVVKARLFERVRVYKNAALFFGIAGALGFAGLVALLVGMIETLATVVGPGVGTAIVVVVVFAVAAICAMIGKGTLAKPMPEKRA